MQNKLENLSASQIGEAVRTKKISPIEVVEYFKQRIIANNEKINAFVYEAFSYAEKEAVKLQKRIDAGEDVGPFAGVPFALKDFLPSKKGWTHSHGGVECLIKQDPYTARFCEAMERAGGIAIGKTNAPAYGFRGTTDNKMYGPTSTPFNLAYNAGGSSGGSAAAVAGGLVPIAEGGDAGGSIRIPASCCNLFGFKPGVGTVPSVCRPDAWSATHPLCFAGGLTKTVEDAAILLDYMAGYDARDPYSYPTDISFKKEFNKPIKDLKIAYTPNFNIFEVDPEVEALVKKCAYRFKELGASVTKVNFKFSHTADEFAEQWCKGITIDCALELNHDKAEGLDYLANHAEDFPEEFIYWKKKCDKLTIEDMYKYNLARTDILDQFEKIFEKYDIIISPVMSCLPILNAKNRNTKGPKKINDKLIEPLIGWTQTFLVNFVGYPAASVPAGLLGDDLPVGMHIIGKRHRDIDVLKAARMFEKLQPWQKNFDKIKLD